MAKRMKTTLMAIVVASASMITATSSTARVILSHCEGSEVDKWNGKWVKADGWAADYLIDPDRHLWCQPTFNKHCTPIPMAKMDHGWVVLKEEKNGPVHLVVHMGLGYENVEDIFTNDTPPNKLYIYKNGICKVMPEKDF